MKQYMLFVLLTMLISGCSSKDETPLKDRIYDFSISECQKECGKDSLGILENRIQNGDLHVRLGYIVNCSWKQGYIEDVYNRNDSLFLKLDRPHTVDTIQNNDTTLEIEKWYPHADCDCFFFFQFNLKDYKNVPATIRIVEPFDENKFWDERPLKEYMDIEETIIETLQ